MSTLFSYSDIPLSERRLPLTPSVSQDDPFVYIERQSRHLQRQIQSLLDAQSDGLLAGMRSPGYANSDVLSNESSTPPASAIGSLGGAVRTIPVRQPPRKKISLRAARKGILRSMSDLLSLREEEKQIIKDRIQQRRDAVGEVDTFSNKKAGLERMISDMENDREGQRARELKGEAQSLEHDIQELELRLADMKARHRHIIQEVTQIENAVDAKLSSYKESLSIIDSEVSRYLMDPPLQPLRPDHEKSSFYSLHPKRRTLDMARDHWRVEESELMKRQDDVDVEITALDEGGPVWQSVVKEVLEFERRLKNEMQQSMMISKSMLSGAENHANQKEQGERIIEDLRVTTRHVEEKLELAEEKDWRLLVCSIGAELAALREAQNMIKDIFGYTEDNNSEKETGLPIQIGEKSNSILQLSEQTRNDKDIDQHTSTFENPPTITMSEDEHADEPPADLLKDPMSEEVKPSTFRSEDEDDEPDPAWLLSDP